MKCTTMRLPKLEQFVCVSETSFQYKTDRNCSGSVMNVFSFEVRGLKPEVRTLKSEVRSLKSELQSLNSELRKKLEGCISARKRPVVF